MISPLLLWGCMPPPIVSTQNFTVTTPPVEGARCRLTDHQGKQWYIPSTPGSIMIQRGESPLTLICTKEAYKTTTLIVHDEGNLVTNAGKIAGYMPNFPAEVTVYMEPRLWKSEAEKDEWNMQKLIRERKLEDAKRQCKFSHYKNC